MATKTQTPRQKPTAGLTTEERILRILRHEENVHVEQITEALLVLIEGLPTIAEKALAIETIGREARWAYFSGEETPETEYPKIKDEQTEPKISKKLAMRVKIAVDKITIEKPGDLELAQLLWKIVIHPTKNRTDRRNALGFVTGLFMDKKPELPEVVKKEITDTAFQAIIFKNRRLIEQLEACLQIDAFKTKSEIGEAILATLAKIDESDRAMVLGTVLSKVIDLAHRQELLQNCAPHGAKLTLVGPDGRPGEEKAGGLLGGRRPKC